MAHPAIRRAGAEIFMVRPDIKKHLALTAKVLTGSGGRDRTYDQLINSQLPPLSYAGT